MRNVSHHHLLLTLQESPIHNKIMEDISTATQSMLPAIFDTYKRKKRLHIILININSLVTDNPSLTEIELDKQLIKWVDGNLTNWCSFNVFNVHIL